MIDKEDFFSYREAPAAQFKHGCLEVTPPTVHGKDFLTITTPLSVSAARTVFFTPAANVLNENEIGVKSAMDTYPPCNEQAASVGHRNRFAQGDAAELNR